MATIWDNLMTGQPVFGDKHPDSFGNKLGNDTVSKILTGAAVKRPQINIDITDVKKHLGTQMLKKMEDMSIDVCSNFLAGQVTSAFTNPYVSSTLSGLMNAYGQGVGLYNKALDRYDKYISGANEIIDEKIKLIKNYTQSVGKMIIDKGIQLGNYYLNEAAKIPVEWATYVAARTSYWFNAYLIPMSTIVREEYAMLDSVRNSSAQITLETTEQKINAENVDRNKKAQERWLKTVDNVTNAINVGAEWANFALDLIPTYIEAGPNWVIQKSSEFINIGLTAGITFADDMYKKGVDELFKGGDATGKGIGKGLAKKANDWTRSEIKKQVAEIQQNNLQGEAIANAKKRSIKLKLRLLLGGA